MICIPELEIHKNSGWHLTAGECLINIYKHNREDINTESVEATAHHFEVWKKDVYELLREDKYMKPPKKWESAPPIEAPSS